MMKKTYLHLSRPIWPQSPIREKAEAREVLDTLPEGKVTGDAADEPVLSESLTLRIWSIWHRNHTIITAPLTIT